MDRNPGDEDERLPPEDDAAEETDAEGQDEGAEAAEGDEDQGSDVLEDQQEQAAGREPSRGERHIGKLRAEAREAKQAAADAQRLVAQLQERISGLQPQQQGETPQAREARRALMTVEERMAEDIRETKQETANLVRNLQLNTMEATDKAAYDAKASMNQVYQKHTEEVERRCMEVKKTGGFIPREEMLKWVIGNEALRAASGQRKQAQKEGQRRLNNERSNPGGSKGDQEGRRGRREQSLEDKLADVTF